MVTALNTSLIKALDQAIAIASTISLAGPNRVYLSAHALPYGAQVFTSKAGTQYYLPSLPRPPAPAGWKPQPPGTVYVNTPTGWVPAAAGSTTPPPATTPPTPPATPPVTPPPPVVPPPLTPPVTPPVAPPVAPPVTPPTDGGPFRPPPGGVLKDKNGTEINPGVYLEVANPKTGIPAAGYVSNIDLTTGIITLVNGSGVTSTVKARHALKDGVVNARPRPPFGTTTPPVTPPVTPPTPPTTPPPSGGGNYATYPISGRYQPGGTHVGLDQNGDPVTIGDTVVFSDPTSPTKPPVTGMVKDGLAASGRLWVEDSTGRTYDVYADATQLYTPPVTPPPTTTPPPTPAPKTTATSNPTLAAMSDAELRTHISDLTRARAAAQTTISKLIAKHGVQGWMSDPTALKSMSKALRASAAASQDYDAAKAEHAQRGSPAPTIPTPQPTNTHRITYDGPLAAYVPGGTDANMKKATNVATSNLGYNQTPDQVVGVVANILQHSYIMIRSRSRSVEKILDAGEYANQHSPQVTVSGGAYNPAYRKDSERNLWGIPTSAGWRERPIFAGIQMDDYVPYGLSGYGEYAFKLKPHVHERSTITCSNSLGTAGNQMPSPYMAPHIASVGHQAYTLRSMGTSGNPADDAKAAYQTVGSYFEAQIHGGINLSTDVEKLYVAFEPPQRIKDKLAKLGIPYEVNAKIANG